MPAMHLAPIAIAAIAVSAAPEVPRRPVHTYSIVARDPPTGEIGVAVQSHWFSVGSAVPWAEAGVGAVATQSFVDPSYGPLGLEMMRAGRSAPDASARPARRGHRARGPAGGHDRRAGTGRGPHRGEEHPGRRPHVGKGYSVQANLMANDKVWPAMARAFEAAKGGPRPNA